MKTGTLVDVQTHQKRQISFVFGRFMHFDAKHMVMIRSVRVGGEGGGLAFKSSPL